MTESVACVLASGFIVINISELPLCSSPLCRGILTDFRKQKNRGVKTSAPSDVAGL
jgi:hypothetical protein